MKNRLLSIDVFRGMTIAFMIIVNTPGSWNYVYPPLLHAEWHGCTPTDLVFPFFIFAIGLSMAFSFSKIAIDQRSKLIRKIIKRSALIFLVGLLLNWFPFYTKSIFDVRLFGVLQRIALSYLIAGLLVAYIRNETPLTFLGFGILVLYWAIQYLGGGYSLEENVNGLIDQVLMPEKNLYGGFGIKFDPEGILGSISAAAQIIFGFIIGKRVFDSRENLIEFCRKAAIIGMGLLTIGCIWSFIYPINKPLWTGSYVLFSTGWAIWLFILLVFLLDVKKQRKWAFPFKVFGMNSLFSFVLSGVLVKIMLYIIRIDGRNAYTIIYHDLFKPAFGDYNGSFLFALFITGVVFLFSLILYRKKIWIKL